MMLPSLTRREILSAGVGAFTMMRGLSLHGELQSPAFEVIDCHTHFYDPTRPEGIPWPAKGSSIYRTVLPEHLRALKQYRRVTGTVIVEASDRLEDNAWLLNLAKDDPFVVGIVGHLVPGTKEFADHVKRFSADPLFRGIRISSDLLTQLLDKNQLQDLRLLADSDLVLDVNGGPDTPSILARLAPQIPQLRIVLNHIGNVRITADPPPEAWVAGIQAAARHENVSCKISAFCSAAAESGKETPGDLEFYRPYIDVVWNAFGDTRVMYGSDWPTGETAADYETQQRISMEYAFGKSEEAARRFCGLNAKQIYKWIDRPGRV